MTRLLYVDDEELNLKVFQISFRKKYEVIIQDNPKEALEILENDNDIQVVISDMRMPDMNGIQFIREAFPKHKNIKFFLLTGYEMTEEIAQALEEGLIQEYFQKPFNVKMIEEKIELALN